MKLVHKIIIGNVLMIMFIAAVYAFSYQKFDLLLNKLQFVEIADSLNATLLKMRLSEKNYFLYRDKSDIPLIRRDLTRSVKSIADEKTILSGPSGSRTSTGWKRVSKDMNRKSSAGGIRSIHPGDGAIFAGGRTNLKETVRQHDHAGKRVGQ